MLTLYVTEKFKGKVKKKRVIYDPDRPHLWEEKLGKDFPQLVYEHPSLLKRGAKLFVEGKEYEVLEVKSPLFEVDHSYYILPRTSDDHMVFVHGRKEQNGVWSYEVISSLLEGMTDFLEKDLLKFLTEGVE